MPTQIINYSGPQYGMIINPDGSINVSGIDLSIGSLALSLENVYVTSGNVALYDGDLTYGRNYKTDLIYITSGTATGVTGSEIGSIIKYHSAGSYVQVLSYQDNVLISAGSWS